MSIRAIAAVLDDSKAKGSDRLVAIVLADAADDAGVCWPTLDTIRRKALCSLRSAVDAVKSLELRGELCVLRRHRKNNVYRLLYDSLDQRHTKLHESDPDFECRFCTLADSLGADVAGKDCTPPVKETRSTDSSLREESRSGALAVVRSRELSISEQIADKHLAVLADKLGAGYGFDLVEEVSNVWTAAWNEAASTDGANPKAAGMRLAARLYETLTDTPPEWGKIGRLVSRFGKLSIVGIAAAVANDIDDFLPYATRVCEEDKKRREARRTARST